MARNAICDSARPDNRPHTLRRPDVPDRFRFYRAPKVAIQSSDGGTAHLPLVAQSVATFYGRLMGELDRMNLHVAIHCKPNEVPAPVRFDEDDAPRAYNPDYANRFWRVLLQVDRVFKTFRARFIGKCSPVHFFWGAADLAVTRFSGRSAPRHIRAAYRIFRIG